MAAAVLIHFAITIIHGIVHARAHVPLSAAASAFVVVVILAGPWVGLGLIGVVRRAGLWLIVLTMSAAFVFGLVNHFMLSSPDHITHVTLEWRTLFAASAVMLALTEATTGTLAFRYLRVRRSL